MPICFEAIHPMYLPYVHQQKAFERLTGDDGRSTLVATDTGSGKTAVKAACFFLQSLDLRRARNKIPFSIIRIKAAVDGYPLFITTRNGCEMPIVSHTRSIYSSASRILSNLHLWQSLSRIIRFITSYRHPIPMETCGFVSFLLDVWKSICSRK